MMAVRSNLADAVSYYARSHIRYRKELGLENKEVLGKAKEMGIAAAKVPSSTLDKITAEYFEEELRKVYAERIAAIAAAAAPPPPPPPEPEPPAPPPPELPPARRLSPEPPPVAEVVELPSVAVETTIPTPAPQAAPPVEAPPVVVEIVTPAPEVLTPPRPRHQAPKRRCSSYLHLCRSRRWKWFRRRPRLRLRRRRRPHRHAWVTRLDSFNFHPPAPRGEKAGVAKVPPGRPGARPEPPAAGTMPGVAGAVSPSNRVRSRRACAICSRDRIRKRQRRPRPSSWPRPQAR